VENPLVTVNVPDTLVALVTYAHRLDFDHDDEPASGFLSRPMDGVLLPHQDLRVQWYLKSSVEQRRQNLA
jgi:hypothetical protein